MSSHQMWAASALAASSVLFAACDGGQSYDGPMGSRSTDATMARSAAADDVVVIAVIDSGVNPYHHDYLASMMPQHQDADPSNDLPLDQDPATWLPGHPGAKAFASYDALNLSLSEDPNAFAADLHALDQAEWDKVRYSEGTENDEVHMFWVPGTKVIGHVAFAPGSIGDPATSLVLGTPSGPVDTWAADSHGTGSASVSSGNIYGSCANCLLVYVHGTSEQANEWVAKQDWIDAQTNSWGASTVYRERAYAGSDTELQREAVNRGQQIFFSAGNGQANAFVAPNTTLLSSQEGPDWIVTVGAIDPFDGSTFSGHGKPADISSIGTGYPAGRGASVTAEGSFGGTSNATPVTAGIYAQALYQVRQELAGPSRMQTGGVIAVGSAGCGPANADCANADGMITVHELREALFRAARYTDEIWNVGGAAPLPSGTPLDPELEFVGEGHGSYWGRMRSDEELAEDVQRIVDFVMGRWFEEQDPAQVEWFTADSICRQAIWGEWEHGYAARNPAPAADPSQPMRTFLAEVCPVALPPLVTPLELIHGG